MNIYESCSMEDNGTGIRTWRDVQRPPLPEGQLDGEGSPAATTPGALEGIVKAHIYII